MTASTTAVPVLDIGGTHVTAALVDDNKILQQHREPLDSHATADQIVQQIVNAAECIEVQRDHAIWGVAVPGPFDYKHGVGDFTGVDKFAELHGFPLGAALTEALPAAPSEVRFVNDAEAYALGEWVASGQPERLICITLGTGVGSGFIHRGKAVTNGSLVPLDGNIHTELWQGNPLEHAVSRDAIRASFAGRTGASPVLDVKDVAALARLNDHDAQQVLTEAMGALGAVLARWVDRFLPDLVVIGGSIAQSWDVLEPGLRYGLGAVGNEPALVRAHNLDHAPLLGAAAHVRL